MPKIILAAILATSLASAAAAEPAAEVGVGIDYEEGDYGIDETIERITVRNEARARNGDVLITATLPWHRVAAPGNVVGGGGGPLGLPILIDPTRPALRDVRSGIGDLRIGAFWAPSLGGFDLAVGGEAKLPTASARRGLGTGETDVAAVAEVSRRFGAVTPFAGASYTIPGDPEGYELDEALALRGGVAVRLAPGLSGSLSYGYGQSLSPLVADEEQVSTGLEVGLSGRLSLGVQGGIGLSDGSPDASAGIRIGWRVF